MRIEVIETRSDVADVLIREVRRFNDDSVGPAGSMPLGVFAWDEGGALIGGLAGRTVYKHLLIEVLWVAEHSRGRRLGKQLMQMAEGEARARGCVAAQVDTLSFQAPGFYQKLGYEVVGSIDDFPEGHTRYFMLKRFRSHPAGPPRLEAD